MSQNKTSYTIIIVGLIIGIVIGFAVEYVLTLSTITNLKGDNSVLNSQVSSLTSDKSSLQTQVSTLNSQVNSLLSDKNSLESEVTELEEFGFWLQSIVDMEVREFIVKDSDFEVITYYDLFYDLNYAGYLEVTFRIIGEADISIKETGLSYTYPFEANPRSISVEIPEFPSFNGITSGSFTIPVVPGETNIHFENPHKGSPIAMVTLTVEFIY